MWQHCCLVSRHDQGSMMDAPAAPINTKNNRRSSRSTSAFIPQDEQQRGSEAPDAQTSPGDAATASMPSPDSYALDSLPNNVGDHPPQNRKIRTVAAQVATRAAKLVA